MRKSELTMLSGDTTPQGRHYPGLEQLIVAALADPGLAARLVTNPKAALTQKIPGVELSLEEISLILSVTGTENIHTFAAELYERIQRRDRHTGQ